MLTLLSLGGPPHSQIGLFEGSPFEILLVATTFNLSSFTLVTGRFGFIALQPLRLAGDATWAMRIDRVSSLRR